MSTAQQLFLAYGTIILAVGMTLGIILGMLRANQPDIRSLALAHVEVLMQSSMHFGLAFAVGAVGFESGWATTAATLLVVGSAMQATGATLNWVTKTRDQFAEKSIGWRINSTSTFAMAPGMAIAAIGILANL